MTSIQDTTRNDVIENARSAAETASADQSVTPDAAPDIIQTAQDQAAKLFDQYFAGAEKKGEAPETAAPKIAKIVAKKLQRDIDALIAKAPKTAVPAIVGTVTGKTSGVNRKILRILNAVSAHFDTPLTVISGKRDPKAQATAMFMGWQRHLRQGKAYAHLRSNDKLRLKLDDLKQGKDRQGFVDHVLAKLDLTKITPHMTGDAVDLPHTTPPEIIEALATVLHHEPEKNTEGTRCHHFDTRKALWPIPLAARERWKT